jgi:hypothetical protein
VAVRVRADPRTVRGDDVEAEDVVAGQPVLPHEAPDAATEGQAGDTGVRDHPSRRRQPVSDGLPVELRPEGACCRDGGSALAIDVDAPHQGQVDQHSSVDRARARRAMASAADRDRQVVVPRERDGRLHVGHTHAARDDRGATVVEHAVPGDPCFVVARVPVHQDGPERRLPQRLQPLRIDRSVGHPSPAFCRCDRHLRGSAGGAGHLPAGPGSDAVRLRAGGGARAGTNPSTTRRPSHQTFGLSTSRIATLDRMDKAAHAALTSTIRLVEDEPDRDCRPPVARTTSRGS